MDARREPRTARRIVRASIAAAFVLIVGAGVLRGLRESARLAAAAAGSASAPASAGVSASNPAAPGRSGE